LVDQLVSSNILKSRITNVLQPGYAARYHKLKSAIQNHLTPLGFTIPTTTSGRKGQDDGRHSEVAGGYFIWLHLPSSIRASDLAQRAIDEVNLKIGSGTLFQVAGDPLLEFEDWLRLCFAWEEVDALEEGIKRLARVAGRLVAENA
jgi:DNA-binding transcriptional MocR family regulator